MTTFIHSPAVADHFAPNQSHFLSLKFLTEKTERWICVNPGDHVFPNFDDSCNQNFNNTNTYTRLITSVRLTFPSMFVDTSNYPMSSQHNRHHHIFTKHLVATSNLVWGIFESVDSKSGLRFWMRLKGRSN